MTEKDQAIEELKVFQTEIVKNIHESGEFSNYIGENYKKGYNNFYDYQKVVEKSLDEIITRYESTGYAHTSTDSLKLQLLLWKFVKNNPEQWGEMIKDIKHSDSSYDLSKIEGISFIDTFIHNGIYDDWNLVACKRDKELYFVNLDSVSEQQYTDKGFIKNHKIENVIQDVVGFKPSIKPVSKKIK